MALAVSVHAAGEEETVARNFLKFLRSNKVILSSEVLQGNLLDPALSPVMAGHLFHLDGGGYLLISSDRSISPVKAYSLVGDFSALPEPYRKALLSELELRVRVALEAAGRMPLDAGTSTGVLWDFLLAFEAGRMPLAYTPGAFLLKTRWNQGYPYNKFLSQVGGQTVVAGCVNVAVAQVMRYHGHPASAKGVASYFWDGPPSQVLKTILYRSFNWVNMPEAVDAATPEYQADEVALLIRDIGIANHTDFDFNGSSTSLNSEALTLNFGYSTSLSEMSNTPSFEAFLTTLKNEIDGERPVLLTFPGHMTVTDGYSADNSGRKVHVNMGWGGSADNFYFLDEPVNAGGYIFPVSAGELKIHYNMKPCSAAAGDCAVNLEAGDGIAEFVVTGNFNDEKDTDRYGVYLKGATTLAANRGYSNVAFYGSILNAADGSEVFTMDVDSPSGVPVAAGALAAGKYFLRASLCNVAGSRCYTDWPSSNAYTVSLTSGTPTAEEKALIDQALEKAPIIGSVVPESPLPDLLLNTTAGTRKILIDARDENGDAITLSVRNSNPAAVGAALNGNILELTPAGTAKVSSRIAVTATANGMMAEKAFTVMTDNGETGFGKAFTVGGTFASQNDVKTNRVILDGACTIAGDRSDYSNQAFFSSVLDASDNVVASADGFDSSEISASFNRGIYRLRGAICIPGSCYNLADSDTYAFTVSCPDADESTAAIADLLGIDLSGANLPFKKPGDVDADGSVTLADAVLVLQMLSGVDTSGKTIKPANEVSGDQRFGLAESIFVLQAISGLRNP